jgi:hypothetical protein
MENTTNAEIYQRCWTRMPVCSCNPAIHWTKPCFWDTNIDSPRVCKGLGELESRCLAARGAKIPQRKTPTWQCLLEDSFLTIVQSPVPKGWTDDDLWTEVFVILESFCAPSNVLEMRRRFNPTPETRQLNRALCAMERSAIVQRHPPSSSSKSQKPRWTRSHS